MNDRQESRREHDKILNWVLKAFLVLAIVGTVGGFSQFYLSYSLYREVAGLRADHVREGIDRASRIKEWELFRSQLAEAMKTRDGELSKIREQIEEIKRRRASDSVKK